jgi:hypothetical protein
MPGWVNTAQIWLTNNPDLHCALAREFLAHR